jgi:trk system potassium uptake protein TrkH
MGIIVLFVALMPRFGIKARNIASAETPGPTVTKLTSRFTGTAQRLYVLYLIFTGTLMLLLLAGGMSIYDASNHAFTTMATGGFSTYNESIAHFHSNYISWVITLFMFIAGTNFELFFVAAYGHPGKALKNEEFRLYASIVVIATVAITANLMHQGTYNNFREAF